VVDKKRINRKYGGPRRRRGTRGRWPKKARNMSCGKCWSGIKLEIGSQLHLHYQYVGRALRRKKIVKYLRRWCWQNGFFCKLVVTFSRNADNQVIWNSTWPRRKILRNLSQVSIWKVPSSVHTNLKSWSIILRSRKLLAPGQPDFFGHLTQIANKYT
jgi:hypothetical protein